MTRLPVVRTAWLAGFTLATIAAIACGDTDSGPPIATLGTGDTAFEPLSDGDTIFVIQGPQGGFHVLGSVRVSGIDPGDPDDLQDPSNPTTTFRVFMGADRVDLDASSYTQGLDPVADSSQHEMIGRLVILDIQSDDELDGASLRVQVEVTPAAGLGAIDERMLIAAPHPANQ